MTVIGALSSFRELGEMSGYLHCFRHSPEMYLIAGASRIMGLHRQIQIGRPLRLAIYRQLPSAGYRSNKLPSARASVTRIRCPFRSSTDVGYIDKRIVAARRRCQRLGIFGEDWLSRY